MADEDKKKTAKKTSSKKPAKKTTAKKKKTSTSTKATKSFAKKTVSKKATTKKSTAKKTSTKKTSAKRKVNKSKIAEFKPEKPVYRPSQDEVIIDEANNTETRAEKVDRQLTAELNVLAIIGISAIVLGVFGNLLGVLSKKVLSLFVVVGFWLLLIYLKNRKRK